MGRVVRVLLVLGLVIAAGLAGWQIWSLEQARGAQRAAFDRLQATATRTRHAMLDARAAQRAYVSPGQSAAYWQPLVERDLAQLRDDLQELKTSAPSASAASAAADDVALEALGEVTRLEKRIAEHALAGRLDHASDLLYADGVRTSLALEQAVQMALAAHRADLVAQQWHSRRGELIIVILCAALGFLAALLLTTRSTGKQDADTEDADTSARAQDAAGPSGTTSGAAASAHAAESTRMIPRPSTAGAREPGAAGSAAGSRAGSSGGARSGGIAGGAASSGAGAGAVPAAAVAAAANPSPRTASWLTRSAQESADSPSLAASPSASPTASGSPLATPAAADALMAAADLCTAMARVGDAAGLQPLLAGLTRQLDAVGVIVWLEDAASNTLTPAMSHGYTPQTIASVLAIDRQADNATARAFRHAESQIVDGNVSGPGAIVVPMQTAAGCVGVLAAELRHGRERDPGTLAVARILAAQLAMLTGPSPESQA